MNQHHIGDPGPAGLSLFGFTLVMLGLQEVVSASVAGGLLYAILVAGIFQAAAAGISLLRGETYLPAILGTFGMWLVGFYFLLSSPTMANPVSEGTYTLVLLGPISYLSLVAYRGSNQVLKYAFVTVTIAVICLGLGFLMESHALLVVAGLFSFICAPAIWYLAYERIVHAMEHEAARHQDDPAELELGSDGHRVPV